MNDLARKISIILNIGGIVASFFGIICVVKIAFVKPWKESSSKGGLTQTAKVSETGPYAGKVNVADLELIRSRDEAKVEAVAKQEKAPRENRQVNVDKVEEVAPTIADRTPESAEPVELKPVIKAKPVIITEPEPEEKLVQVEVGEPKSVRKRTLLGLLFGRKKGRDTESLADTSNSTGGLSPKPFLRSPQRDGDRAVDSGVEEFSTIRKFKAPQRSNTEEQTSKILRMKQTSIEGLSVMSSEIATQLVEQFVSGQGYSVPRIELGSQRTEVYAQRQNKSGEREQICLSFGKEVDAARESKERSDYYPVAREGVVIIVHPSNPRNHMHLSQLGGIFSGQTKTWPGANKAKGTPKSKVAIYIDGVDASTTTRLLDDLLLQPLEQTFASDGVRVVADAKNVITKVANDTSSIGAIPLSMLSECADVKVVAMSVVANSLAVIPSRYSYDYALSQKVVVGISEDDDSESYSLAKQFYDFVLSREGQVIINDSNSYLGDVKATNKELACYQKSIDYLARHPDVLSSYKKAIEGATRVHSPHNFRFQNGEMILTTESEIELDRLVERLKQMEPQPAAIKLFGFADSIGRYKENKVLSTQRAMIVRDLLEAEGIEGIRTAGYGEEMPVSNNAIAEGRALNRRVEVWVVDK